MSSKGWGCHKNRFQCVTWKLKKALCNIPFEGFGISEEVKEQALQALEGQHYFWLWLESLAMICRLAIGDQKDYNVLVDYVLKVSNKVFMTVSEQSDGGRNTTQWWKYINWLDNGIACYKNQRSDAILIGSVKMIDTDCHANPSEAKLAPMARFRPVACGLRYAVR
ncbi:hypothetical protein Droror1_Dr00020706 [Drosera rotundifolia]